MSDSQAEHLMAEAQAKADRLTPEIARMQREMAQFQAMADRFEPEIKRMKREMAEYQAMADRFEPEFERIRRETNATKAMIARLAPDLSFIRESAELTTKFSREIKAWAADFQSPFEMAVLNDRTWTYLRKSFDEEQKRILEWAKQGQQDHLLISAELPKRGWYMSGREPCTLSHRLARAVRDGNWDEVDRQMMEHLPQYKMDVLREWLTEEGVPQHCINRLGLFLKHHKDGNYEEATYLGVPLLDEIAKYLYKGKTFTTKRANRRGDQSKPELAFKTASGPILGEFSQSFVQAFGSLQEDPHHHLLADENYWNRHAIVHGLMQRPMGIKDSAKCLVAINFLFFARREEAKEPAAEPEPTQAGRP